MIELQAGERDHACVTELPTAWCLQQVLLTRRTLQSGRKR